MRVKSGKAAPPVGPHTRLHTSSLSDRRTTAAATFKHLTLLPRFRRTGQSPDTLFLSAKERAHSITALAFDLGVLYAVHRLHRLSFHLTYACEMHQDSKPWKPTSAAPGALNVPEAALRCRRIALQASHLSWRRRDGGTLSHLITFGEAFRSRHTLHELLCVGEPAPRDLDCN